MSDPRRSVARSHEGRARRGNGCIGGSKNAAVRWDRRCHRGGAPAWRTGTTGAGAAGERPLVASSRGSVGVHTSGSARPKRASRPAGSRLPGRSRAPHAGEHRNAPYLGPPPPPRSAPAPFARRQSGAASGLSRAAPAGTAAVGDRSLGAGARSSICWSRARPQRRGNGTHLRAALSGAGGAGTERRREAMRQHRGLPGPGVPHGRAEPEPSGGGERCTGGRTRQALPLRGIGRRCTKWDLGGPGRGAGITSQHPATKSSARCPAQAAGMERCGSKRIRGKGPCNFSCAKPWHPGTGRRQFKVGKLRSAPNASAAVCNSNSLAPELQELGLWVTSERETRVPVSSPLFVRVYYYHFVLRDLVFDGLFFYCCLFVFRMIKRYRRLLADKRCDRRPKVGISPPRFYFKTKLRCVTQRRTRKKTNHLP